MNSIETLREADDELQRLMRLVAAAVADVGSRLRQLQTTAPTALTIVESIQTTVGRLEGEAAHLADAQRRIERLIGDERAAKKRAEDPKYEKGRPTNMMTHPYWGKHAFAWGSKPGVSQAVKYSVIPCENHYGLTVKSQGEEDYQLKFIEDAFRANGEVCFYFRIQARPKNATEKTYPIENAKVEWNVKNAPFVHVAKVVFKDQENRKRQSAESIETCNTKTEFNPWNGLQAHQHLGSIARGRRIAYKASALVRQKEQDLKLPPFPQKTGQ